MTTVRDQVERAVQELNSRLTPNFVNTFQFVSIEDTDCARLTWSTFSLDTNLYEKATFNFIEYDADDKTISRSLLPFDYELGPYWYTELGTDPIRDPLAPEDAIYSFKLNPDQKFFAPSGDSNELRRLLVLWRQELRTAFDSRGSTMWVTQPHSEQDTGKVVSSVFLLLNNAIPVKDFQGADLRYSVAKLLRDFLIDYLVSLYSRRIESKYRILEDEYSKMLTPTSRDRYIGSIATKRIENLAPAVRSGVPVFITGETGTGKTMVASTLFELSGRGGDFRTVNCAIYTIDRREEFRHQVRDYISGSANVTFVLENISSAPRAIQLEIEDVIDRSLSLHENSSARFILTGAANCAELVANGDLVESLYYTISPFRLSLPPLRSRKDELLTIADAILQDLPSWFSGRGTKSLSEDARQALLAYDFPGNTRELRNILLRAYFLTSSDVIGAAEIRG